MTRRRKRGSVLASIAVLAAVLAACANDTDPAANGPPATTSAPPSTAGPATADTADPAAGEAEAPVTEAEAADDPIVVAAGAPRTGSDAPRSAFRAASNSRIDIPKIGLSHPTFEGIDLRTINRGPSHWPGTAMPGEPGNTVFPGHRTTYTRPFWDIDKLVPGDEVIFTTPAGRFTYVVTETLVVGARDTWITDPTEQPTFTIFACHPKGSARQRYVVKGALVSAPAAASTTTTTAPPAPPSTAPTTSTSPPPNQTLVPPLPG